MKIVAFALISNLTSLACALVGGWLAWNNRDGWGWFLFMAYITSRDIEFEQ